MAVSLPSQASDAHGSNIIQQKKHVDSNAQAVSNFTSMTIFEGLLVVGLHLLLHQAPLRHWHSNSCSGDSSNDANMAGMLALQGTPLF